MFSKNIFENNPHEQYDATTLTGLIAAVIDDEVQSFTYRGLEIGMDDRTMTISDPATGKNLGRMIIVGAPPIEKTREWVELKADIHGVPA